MKTASYLVVVVLALIAVQPVYAGACEPEPVWVSGTGSAALGQDFSVEYGVAFHSVNFLIIDSAYSYQIIKQDISGFTARLVPISADRSVIGYYTYYIFGYESAPCYCINLPMVIH